MRSIFRPNTKQITEGYKEPNDKDSMNVFFTKLYDYDDENKEDKF
jgi:hypothetical protein